MRSKTLLSIFVASLMAYTTSAQKMNVLLHMSATLRRVGITVPTNGFTVYDARQFWVGREQIGERVKVYI